MAATTFIKEYSTSEFSSQAEFDSTIHGQLTKWSDYADIFLNVIYIFEFLIKSIAMGLVLDKNSYLSVSWNKLDFIIVVTSVWEMILNLALG